MYCPWITSAKYHMRKSSLLRSLYPLVCLPLFCLLASAENPHWIWHDNKGVAIKPDEVRFFRKTFHLAAKPSKAPLSVAADDEAVIYINGKEVVHPKDYAKPVSKGKLGDQPWGDVLTVPKATAAESLTVLPGFKVELLHSAEVGEGSWICMTVDDKGRLIISPQADNQPLLRLTLSRSGKVAKIEPIPAPVHQAMGLLYAHNSLYANAHGPNGTGLYRLIDENHNDRFDTNEVHFLKTFEGEGEHGYHAVVLGPDRMIYVMNGNHTKVPKDIEAESPHKNYEEDFLLTRRWDARGHAAGILAPGGYVVRGDPE